MNNYQISEERKEIRDYLIRFKDTTPEQRLQYISDMRDFFFDNMTPEGRAFFEEQQRKEHMAGWYVPKKN